MEPCFCGCTDRALDEKSAQWRANFYPGVCPPKEAPLVQRDYKAMALMRLLVLKGVLNEDCPQAVLVPRESDAELLRRWHR